MDLFGKILVLVNFALSLMMAAIGGAVLYYRVDWSDNKADATAGTPDGELVARIARVKELQALVTPADASWRSARSALLAQEKRRPADEAWYAAQLQYLKVGEVDAATGAKKKQKFDPPAAAGGKLDRAGDLDPTKPILMLTFDKGLTTPEANGLPQMSGGVDSTGKPTAFAVDRFDQPLQSLFWYNAQSGMTTDETTAVFADLNGQLKEDVNLTIQLLGSRQAPDLIAKVNKQVADWDALYGMKEAHDIPCAAQAVKTELTDLQTLLVGTKDKPQDARGLLERIQTEAVKQKGIDEEIELVRLAEGQVRADFQLLLLRNHALQARVKELTGVAARP